MLVLDVIGGGQVHSLGERLQLRPGRVEAQVHHRVVRLALHHPVLRAADLHTIIIPNSLLPSAEQFIVASLQNQRV